ncbi:MAG: SGNH/GDSL hydrolase family protein [Candidatus Saccharimonadales bacterium]
MKTLIAGSILICSIFLNVALGATSFADSGNDWGRGVPIVVNIQPFSYDPDPVCPRLYERRVVEGYVQSQNLCLFDGRHISAASFFADGARPRFAIAYPFDQKFYPLDGACSDMTGCLYAPEQDTLVVRYESAPNRMGVAIYRHFSQRVHRQYDLLTGEVSHSFDNQHPDFVFDKLRVGGIGMSRNGRWVAMEFVGSGTGMIDLENLETRQIRDAGIPYGYGVDPTEELAVSNDGSTVVITGIRADFSIIRVNPTCGFPLSQTAATEHTPCPVIVFTTNGFIASFKFGTHPQFEESGGQLKLDVMTYTDGAKRVMIRAAGYRTISELPFLALGDSFSSGEGESDDRFYLPASNNGVHLCHISRRSYPFLLASYMMIPLDGVKSIACAGARIDDIVGTSKEYNGQNNRLRGTDVLKSQANALVDFLPGRIYQALFVEQYHPKLITMSVGGNDAGFSAKLKTCAMPGTCEWAKRGIERSLTGIEIRDLFDKLVTTYKQLTESSPWSRIYAVGYPKITAIHGVCDPLTNVLLDEDERTFISEGVRYLNSVIRAAVEAAHISYLDVEDSLTGRQLCSTSSLPSAVNGIRVGDDIAPLGVLPTLKIIGNESFHPNPIGHELEALAINRMYGDLNLPHTCNSCSATVPEPPAYWGVVTGDKRQYYASFLRSEHLTPLSKLSIELPSHTFQPDTEVRVEIHSDLKEVGRVRASSEGGLAVELPLPNNIVEGFHSIHLYGTSYARHSIDLYEVISYGNNIEKSVERVSATVPRTTGDDRSPGAVLGVSDIPQIRAVQRVSKSVMEQKDSKKDTLLFEVAVISATLLGVILLSIIAIERYTRKNSPQDRGG